MIDVEKKTTSLANVMLDTKKNAFQIKFQNAIGKTEKSRSQKNYAVVWVKATFC